MINVENLTEIFLFLFVGIIKYSAISSAIIEINLLPFLVGLSNNCFERRLEQITKTSKNTWHRALIGSN
jgi:hypothetical protein